MPFKIFLAIKVGYILIKEIKAAAKDNKITLHEGLIIISKVCEAIGISCISPDVEEIMSYLKSKE